MGESKDVGSYEVDITLTWEFQTSIEIKKYKILNGNELVANTEKTSLKLNKGKHYPTSDFIVQALDADEKLLDQATIYVPQVLINDSYHFTWFTKWGLACRILTFFYLFLLFIVTPHLILNLANGQLLWFDKPHYILYFLKEPETLKLYAFCGLAAVCGQSIYLILDYFKYVRSLTLNLSTYWMYYLVRPWIAGVCAVIALALVRGGSQLLNEDIRLGITSNAGVIGLGFLAGFSLHKIINRFNKLSGSMFDDTPAPPAGKGNTASGNL